LQRCTTGGNGGRGVDLLEDDTRRNGSAICRMRRQPVALRHHSETAVTAGCRR
jgi:hypothetical protein